MHGLCSVAPEYVIHCSLSDPYHLYCMRPLAVANHILKFSLVKTFQIEVTCNTIAKIVSSSSPVERPM